MTITRGGELNLNLLIDKKSQKLLFAEVRKDVVDFLFSLLSLPVGSLGKLITEESTFSTLSNMYRSWEQLDGSCFTKTQMAANSFIPVIKPTSTVNFSLLVCSASRVTAQEMYNCGCNSSFTFVCNNVCESCGLSMKNKLYFGPAVPKAEVERDGYVKNCFAYAVMDDPSLEAMIPFGGIGLLKKMGYMDLSLIEEKTVSLDIRQGLELLKTSFISKNVLTDMFLAKKNEAMLAEEVN